MLPSSFVLENVRNNLILHSFAVFLPLLAVLNATALVIPRSASHQENRHVHDVEVWKEMAKATRSAIGEGDKEVAKIVEVTCKTPKATGEQKRIMDFAINRLIGHSNKGSGLAPNIGLSVGLSHDVFLVIGRSEDVIAQKTSSKNKSKLPPWQVHRMSDKEEPLQSVHEGQPNWISPP